jgi:hypothetical protein
MADALQPVHSRKIGRSYPAPGAKQRRRRIAQARHSGPGNRLQTAQREKRLVYAVYPQPGNPALPPLDDVITVGQQVMLAERPLQQPDLQPRTVNRRVLRCLAGHEALSTA